MRVTCYLLLSVLILCPPVLYCQTGQVTGKIVDAQTQEPLPFAHVFVSNTTRGATSDLEGNFLLKNVPVGTHDLIFSSIGYQTFQSKAAVAEAQTVTMNVQLTPSLHELSAVEVKGTRDKEWLKQMKQFERVFFGEEFASSCKIHNPWVIEFATTGNSKVFAAMASAPMEITNHYLGYSVVFHLKNFQSNGQTFTISGNAYFKELTDSLRRKTWEKNRAIVYSGSERHLFTSILKGTATKEGFTLYTDNRARLM